MTTLGCKCDTKRMQEGGREREREDAKKEMRDEAHSGALRLTLKGKPKLVIGRWRLPWNTVSAYVHVKQNMYIIRMNGKWPLVWCLILWSSCHHNLAIRGTHACAKTLPLTWLGMVPWYVRLKCPGLAAGVFIVAVSKMCMTKSTIAERLWAYSESMQIIAKCWQYTACIANAAVTWIHPLGHFSYQHNGSCISNLHYCIFCVSHVIASSFPAFSLQFSAFSNCPHFNRISARSCDTKVLVSPPFPSRPYQHLIGILVPSPFLVSDSGALVAFFL